MGDQPTAKQQTYLDALPATDDYAASLLGLSKSTIRDYRSRLMDKGYEFTTNVEDEYVVTNASDVTDEPEQEENTSTTDLPDLSDVEPEGEPEPSDLTGRERVVVSELQSGATLDELAEELDERQSVVTQHIRDVKQQGWQVYIDEDTETVAIEGDQPLRSSEHTGTRTRKANKWWELSHNKLVREFRGLATPTADMEGTTGNEDWVTHLTDLHAGDIVRDDNGEVVYETESIPDVVEYVTEQSLNLARKHNSTYDTAHLLWGGDFVTSEGIYEGQFEDLDAWLDKQHEILIDPLIAQLKAFSAEFDTVQVVCQVGNHGQNRASGTSRQANSDLILYKSIRNTVAQLREHAGLLENVEFTIGSATAYKNFTMRGGAIKGHLRHGQHRRPQAETSARKKEWQGTLLDHDFDLAYMGHYHISGRIPWDGPPVIVSPSPKPAGEFVEKIEGKLPGDYQGVATVFGVSDQGITGVYPVDTRNYE